VERSRVDGLGLRNGACAVAPPVALSATVLGRCGTGELRHETSHVEGPAQRSKHPPQPPEPSDVSVLSASTTMPAQHDYDDSDDYIIWLRPCQTLAPPGPPTSCRPRRRLERESVEAAPIECPAPLAWCMLRQAQHGVEIKERLARRYRLGSLPIFAS
jgi:hypothetical protein